jgi:protein arginine kinase
MKSVVKSSIILSRNIDKYPFPAGLTFDASAVVEQEVITAINTLGKNYSHHSLVGLEENEKEVLFAQKLITYNMVRNTIHSSVVECDNRLYFRINDEDHLSIIQESYDHSLQDMWSSTKIIENKLSPQLNFAFDLKLGYLTSRITEVGTGLKLSVVLHLPGILRTAYMNKLIQAVHQVGFSLKEYALGTNSGAHAYYELSNLVTIGKSEEELIEGLDELVDKIEKKEKDALETLISADDKVLEDEIFRSYGLLKNARLISYEESISLLSKVRLGHTIGLLKEQESTVLDTLLFSLHPKLLEGKQLHFARKGESIRAELIRAHLA